MNERLFAIVEYNQASGRPEKIGDDQIATDIEEAMDILQYCREHADALNRREHYEVFELVPVAEWVNGD